MAWLAAKHRGFCNHLPRQKDPLGQGKIGLGLGMPNEVKRAIRSNEQFSKTISVFVPEKRATSCKIIDALRCINLLQAIIHYRKETWVAGREAMDCLGDFRRRFEVRLRFLLGKPAFFEVPMGKSLAFYWERIGWLFAGSRGLVSFHEKPVLNQWI